MWTEGLSTADRPQKKKKKKLAGGPDQQKDGRQYSSSQPNLLAGQANRRLADAAGHIAKLTGLVSPAKDQLILQCSQPNLMARSAQQEAGRYHSTVSQTYWLGWHNRRLAGTVAQSAKLTGWVSPAEGWQIQ